MLRQFALFLGIVSCGESMAAPPRITNFRYDEDYSYLRETAARSGEWWEPLKYIPLSDSGNVYLTLGTELRSHYELLKHDNFGEGPQDNDGYLWLRALPYADLHAGKHLRVFTELITAFAMHRDPSLRTIDENRLDLLQAFADFRLPLFQPDEHVTLRAGRQMLKYGSERLISNRYGPNVLQTFDAVTAFTEMPHWRVDAFWARPIESDLKVFDDQADDSRSLWSLYATHYFDDEHKKGLDGYYIGFHNKNAEFNQGAGEEKRHTLGTRIFGKVSNWDWNVEGFYQFGTFAKGDISAWSVGSDTGYTFKTLPLSPRLSLKANIISGDDDPNDSDLQTFDPLFPKGKYFGEIGLLGPYNLINLHPTLELELNKFWSLSGVTVFYWRENTHDGIYDNAGNLVRPDGGTNERYVGTQTEILLNFHPSRTIEFEAALSRFAAGDFIRATGESKDAFFASLEVKFSF